MNMLGHGVNSETKAMSYKMVLDMNFRSCSLGSLGGQRQICSTAIRGTKKMNILVVCLADIFFCLEKVTLVPVFIWDDF